MLPKGIEKKGGERFHLKTGGARSGKKVVSDYYIRIICAFDPTNNKRTFKPSK